VVKYVGLVKCECETKVKLLRVAMQLIWESSYGAVSVDDICRKAGVNKGSFYHFFRSKSDLAVAAMEADWQEKRACLDEIFSPQVPPLERLARLCELNLAGQKAKMEQCGKVCGCPMITLGAELSTQDEGIRQKTAEILDRYGKYFESVVRDAAAEGLLQTDDPRALARQLFAFSQGMLLQAKVRNDLDLLRDVHAGMLRLLDVQPATA
jgi:TetR/AcrR family transcriptional repressor of nem operon